MMFPSGALAAHFKTDLFHATRGLIGACLGNTVFCRGTLGYAFSCGRSRPTRFFPAATWGTCPTC